MHLSRRAFMASASAAAICLLNKEAFAALHGSIPLVPTVPFVQEVTVAAPDIIRVEIRDPLIQRGTIQYLSSSFPGGTDQQYTTSPNPNPAPQTNVCMPLGYPGNLLTLRFDDIGPSSWLNRLAADVAANWSVTGLTVSNVYRKSYPYCEGQSHSPTPNANISSQRHYIWLKLNSTLVSGTTYTITPPAGTGLSPITLAFNDKVTRACSLLVNQAGHRAGDDLKLAYLSSWIPGFPNDGAVEYATTYGISAFNIIDKTGTVVYSAGTFSQRVTPTQLEVGDNNSGNLRIYRSATQPPVPITGFTKANPGVFTTSNPSAPANGTLVQMQGFGAGIQLTGMSWSATAGGQVTFVGANGSSPGYGVGAYFTVSGASPSGYNGVYKAITGTNSTQLVAALASNPGTASVMGVLSNSAGTALSGPSSGNSSGIFATANASGQTFTLKQVTLPAGTVGADVDTTSWGLWGPGTYLTAAVAQLIGADDNFGVGFDSFLQPCYSANRAGTYVYGLDYSAATIATLPSSGAPYRVQIPGLGVSDPIEITEGSWYNNAWNWMKGMYHQTSGPAIDGRFGYSRPAALVNGLNGCVLKTSFLPMAFSGEDGGYAGVTNFSQGSAALAPFIQTATAPAGLGGAFHDSGDWPSVLYYHWALFYGLLDLGYEFCGGTVGSIAAAQTTTFNFPKASQIYGSLYTPIDTMADAVHCAIYFAEYYRLCQDAFGAVPSGTSFGSIGFGDGGFNELIPSSATSLAFALNAPDHPSTYGFACLAAKIAIQLFNFLGSETPLVTDWVNAAVNAFNWAEGIWNGLQTDPNFYYGSTPYNGTALNVPLNSVNQNLLQSGATPVWTHSSSGSTVNGISATGTITTSSDFTNGTYNSIALTGGSGSGAAATIVVSGNKVTKVIIENPGNNFAVNDVMSCNLTQIGNGTSFSVPVSSLTQAATLDTAIGAPTGPVRSTSISAAGTGGTPGTYTGVPLTGGTGSGAVATIVVGAGGTVTTVTITTNGKGYIYGDLLSAASANIGGVTGLSIKVLSTNPVSGLNLNAWQNRTNAAGALFRLMGILGQSQTVYANAFQGGGQAIGQLESPGIWEVLNAPNNTALTTFLTSINWPTSWVNLANAAYTTASGINAYFTMSGGIGTSISTTLCLYGYLIRVRAAGVSDSTCINVRKMIAAQMATTLGANPVGLCYASGIGARNTLGILHRDWQATTRTVSGFQPPPAGITPPGWPPTVFPTGFNNFSTDSSANFTVILPTGAFEASNGSKRIINPNHQCLPMWEGSVENSYCILTMEPQTFGQWVGLLVSALWMWCWDGNSSKT